MTSIKTILMLSLYWDRTNLSKKVWLSKRFPFEKLFSGSDLKIYKN
jgi:hypothetical protein